MSSTKVKLQTTIPNSNIVIDYWDFKDNDPSIRFMTSIKNHSVRAVAQMRVANYRIYTTLFNKWYLHNFYDISEDRIVDLNYNETKEILDSHTKEVIKVTAIESNYCSGSTMFLFQGSFGNVLYTSYFRLKSATEILMCPALKQVVIEKKLHVAYVDNSYAAEHCDIPSRNEMVQKIIDLIRNIKNSQVLISGTPLGKEELLLGIATKLDEKVDVGSQRFKIFQKLNISDLFTHNSKETRIRMLDNLLSLKECQKIFKQNKSCVIILLTAVYKYGPKKIPSRIKYPRLFVMPYTGHSNHAELKEFVSVIRPHTIFPVMVMKPFIKCSKIPQSVYDLCGKAKESSSGVAEVHPGEKSKDWNCRVLVPRLQVSPLRLKLVNGSYYPSPIANGMKSTSPVIRSRSTSTSKARKLKLAVFADAQLPSPNESSGASAANGATEEPMSELVEVLQNPMRSPNSVAKRADLSVVDTRSAAHTVDTVDTRVSSAAEVQLRGAGTPESRSPEAASQPGQLQRTTVPANRDGSCGVRRVTTLRRVLQPEKPVVEVPVKEVPVEADSPADALSDDCLMIEEYIVDAEDDVQSPSKADSAPSNEPDEVCVADMEVVGETVIVYGTGAESPRQSPSTARCDSSSWEAEGEQGALNTAILSESVYNRAVTSVEPEVISVTSISTCDSQAVDVSPLEDDALFESASSEREVRLVPQEMPIVTVASTSDHESVSCEREERLVPQEMPIVTVASTSERLEDDCCQIVETDRAVCNSSQLVVASAAQLVNGFNNGDLSDSEDCMVVCEYRLENPVHVPVGRPSKRLKLDSTYRSRRNERFVNAIFFHYMKSYPDEVGNLPLDHWDFLSKCNIFLHSAYRS